MFCITSGGNEEDALATFVPWKSAAKECLPEHLSSVYEALTISGSLTPNEARDLQVLLGDKYQKARRVSKQKADKAINDAPIAWDNLFYVLAIGRGSPSGLRPDAVAGLLALLVGHKPTSAQLSEAALFSLTRIFAGSKDEIVTSKILQVWEMHENVDVRQAALLSLFLVGNADRWRYVMFLRDILRGESAGQAMDTNGEEFRKMVEQSGVWASCPDREMVHPTIKFNWDYIKAVIEEKKQASKNVLFCILRIVAAEPATLAKNNVTAIMLFELVTKVLRDGLRRRLEVEAALLLVESKRDEVNKLPTEERQKLLDSVANLRKVTNFTEVKQAALKILKQHGDSRAKCLELFSNLKTLPMEQKPLKDALVAEYPELVSQSTGSADIRQSLRSVSMGGYDPTMGQLPSLVSSLYHLIESSDVKGEQVSRLLASRSWLERFCGLIHVGVQKRTAFRGRVLYLLTTDPLEDIRTWAAKALSVLPVGKEAISQSDRLVELQAQLLQRERLNMVMDLEHITEVQDESEAKAFIDAIR